MSTPFPLPSLRTFAALPSRDAKALLTLAEHAYRLQMRPSAQRGLRRVAAYRRFLKLSTGLPDAFTLTVQSTGMRKRCQVVRRTERCLGVAFTAA